MADIREKISRLMKLAGNNPNVNEAQSALEKARALMMEHNLEERDLPGYEEERRKVEAITDLLDSRTGTNYPEWMGVLAVTIAEAFRCDVYMRTRYVSTKGRTDIHVLGMPSDIEVVKQLYPWIRRAAINLGVQWATKTGGNVDDYYIGFANGLKKAFQTQEEAHQEWGLVLQRDPSVDVLAKKEGVAYTKTRARRVGAGYQDGYTDGYAVGQKRTVN